jgi:hypothetical protein
MFGDYYTPWIDQSFLLLTIPGLLISLVGSTMLGIALLRNRYRPRTTAWLQSPAAASHAKPAPSNTRRRQGLEQP